MNSAGECIACDANLKAFVPRSTPVIGQSKTINNAATIRVHYKQIVPGEKDAYGRQRYKVYFTYVLGDSDQNSQPTFSGWANGDYVNVLTDVKRNVTTSVGSNGVLLPKACKDSAYGNKARLFNAINCQDSSFEKCDYNICCIDNSVFKCCDFYIDDRSIAGNTYKLLERL